jgi:hypothetical protein
VIARTRVAANKLGNETSHKELNANNHGDERNIEI